ncbi:uncharacterized protein LOC113505244 [Trichoplusia ni]|uniref:Uncharacterized protein LOC113505244 n=1 Tax=Trichoplusia ni TaxID=7111 RepID=A0A7E5WSV2_TRINI|nr:uncharacterized protein LOC113505244 [Trichoplusia ni]
MKYLGLVLDGRLNFREHFRRLAPRLRAAATALGRLLPNVGGPDVGCRRLYAGVIRSMALYGAPIWAKTLMPDSRAVLLGAQRAVAIRIVRAYRTVGHEAATALAGTPPWDLEAKVLADLYTRITELRSRGVDPSPRQLENWRGQARLVTLRNWELRLSQPTAGRAICEAIRPHLQPWAERRYGRVDLPASRKCSQGTVPSGTICAASSGGRSRLRAMSAVPMTTPHCTLWPPPPGSDVVELALAPLGVADAVERRGGSIGALLPRAPALADFVCFALRCV